MNTTNNIPTDFKAYRAHRHAVWLSMARESRLMGHRDWACDFLKWAAQVRKEPPPPPALDPATIPF